MWDTSRCKHCHSRVPSIAIYCPHCSTRMPTPSRFSAQNFIIPFWFLLALIIGGAVWFLAGQLGLSNPTTIQSSSAQTTRTVRATPIAPTPLPGPAPADLQIAITDPRGIKPGNWGRLEIAINNKSSLPAHVISIRIQNSYFNGYRVDSTEPINTLIADHVEPDGYRYFDFNGLPSQTAGVYKLNLVRKEGALPDEVKIEIHTQSGKVDQRIIRPQ